MEACWWKPSCNVPTSDHMWAPAAESWAQNRLVRVPWPKLPPELPPAQQPCECGPDPSAEQQPQLIPATGGPPWASSSAPTQHSTSDNPQPHHRGGHHLCSSPCWLVVCPEKCIFHFQHMMIKKCFFSWQQFMYYCLIFNVIFNSYSNGSVSDW